MYRHLFLHVSLSGLCHCATTASPAARAGPSHVSAPGPTPWPKLQATVSSESIRVLGGPTPPLSAGLCRCGLLPDACAQLLAATDKQTLRAVSAGQRRGFRCRHRDDFPCRPPVVLLTSLSLCRRDDLNRERHPNALRGAIQVTFARHFPKNSISVPAE